MQKMQSLNLFLGFAEFNWPVTNPQCHNLCPVNLYCRYSADCVNKQSFRVIKGQGACSLHFSLRLVLVLSSHSSICLSRAQHDFHMSHGNGVMLW